MNDRDKDVKDVKTDDVLGVMDVLDPHEINTAMLNSLANRIGAGINEVGPTKEELLSTLHNCGCAECMKKAAIIENAKVVKSIVYQPETTPSVEEWSTLKAFMLDSFRFDRKSIALEYFERSFSNYSFLQLGSELHDLFAWIANDTHNAILEMYKVFNNPNKQSSLPGIGKYKGDSCGLDDNFLDIVCPTALEKDTVKMVAFLWKQAILLTFHHPYSYDTDPLRALDQTATSHLKVIAAFKILSDIQQSLVQTANDITVEVRLP